MNLKIKSYAYIAIFVSSWLFAQQTTGIVTDTYGISLSDVEIFEENSTHGTRFTKRFSMEVLLIGLFLLFLHGLNKCYPMTFYKYPGCNIVITILLYLFNLLLLIGLLSG